MKIKDKAMNISFCCGTMGNSFLAGKFRLDVAVGSLYFYTTANIKIYFCPFCGTEIVYGGSVKSKPVHRTTITHNHTNKV